MVAFKLLLALLLVFLTGFFVAAELALVKIRSTRLDELAARKVFGAARARDAVHHLHHYLHATKFGVMVCALVLGKVGDEAVHQLLEPFFHSLPAWLMGWLPPLLVILAVTLVEFVLGELVPTTMAIRDAERILLATIYPLDFFYRVFKWPLAAMGAISAAILRPFGYKAIADEEDSHSEAEIRLIVEQSAESGAIKESEVDLVHRVLDFAHRQAKEVMVPRPDIVYLSTDRTMAQNRAIAESAGFTRFPLADAGSTDQLLGMIHLRDLYRFTGDDLRAIVHEIPRVPETKPIDQLLRELQSQRQHMAIVVDEFGGTAGIVTMEDIIEEIVGDIIDERDPTRPEIEPAGQDCYDVDGRMSLEKLRRQLELLDPDTESEIETVGGWVLAQAPGVPRVGEEIPYGEARFTVLELSGRRVRKVRVCVPEPPQDDPDALSPNDD